MTAILHFFINNKKKLVVVSDRQVTYDYELREEDKFFKKGRFYIFCSGSKDVYSQITSEVNSNRSNITLLANFVNDRCNIIIQNSRRQVGFSDDICSFLIIDSKSLDMRIINRGTVSGTTDFGIIGIGENYTQEVYDIFSALAPTGFQLSSIKWSDLFYQKIIQSYNKLALKQPTIGHPALFNLDLFVFRKRGKQQFKIGYKHDVNNAIEYNFLKVRG